MSNRQDDALPELPEAVSVVGSYREWYSADQMRAYAQSAIASLQARLDAAERLLACRDGAIDVCRVALEVIAVGDSDDPKADAADALKDIGVWGADT